MPALPTSPQYQDALQHPEVYFLDPKLKACQIEKDMWGMPKVRSGGFALTYKLMGASGTWAVRCFHKSVPDREQRYAAISRFIDAHSSDIFVPVHYLPSGIRINGSHYPVTQMLWVEGDTLGTYLVRNYRNSALVNALSGEFQRIIAELEKLHIAHGDLSHLNIIVRQGKMILVDYDGMFVPELRGLRSNEIGNIHFQHPARSAEHFDAQLDRFSSIVIYLALNALSLTPRLWEQYQGEGLLFRQGDFVAPDKSDLLKHLLSLPELRSLADRFKQVCRADIAQVPRLADFIAGKALNVQTAPPVHRPVRVSQYPTLSAEITSTLLKNVGEMVTVVGQITAVREDETKFHDPYAFLNFGDYRQGCFTVVLWSEALQLFSIAGKAPGDYWRKWVAVNGVLSRHIGRPQIVVSSPAEITVLRDEEEARSWLNASQRSGSITSAEAASSYHEESPNEPSPSQGEHLAQQPSQLDGSTLPSPYQKKLDKLFAAKAAERPKQAQPDRNLITVPTAPTQSTTKDISKQLDDLYSQPAISAAPTPTIHNVQNSTTSQPTSRYAVMSASPLSANAPSKSSRLQQMIEWLKRFVPLFIIGGITTCLFYGLMLVSGTVPTATSTPLSAVASTNVLRATSTVQPTSNPLDVTPLATTVSGIRHEYTQPMIATTLPVSGSLGPLAVIFSVTAVEIGSDYIQIYIAIHRPSDKPLIWYSDRSRAGEIYVEANGNRYELDDMGGLFIEDTVIEAQSTHTGWLRFQTPAKTGYILHYPDIQPLNINISSIGG